MDFDIKKMMAQAEKLKNQIKEKQEEFAQKTFDGSSGGELVKVTLNGDGKAVAASISPELLKTESENIIPDLIIAAFNNAKEKLDEEAKSIMPNSDMNFNIPGLDKIF